MSDFATRRRQNIEQNEILLNELKPIIPKIEPRNSRSKNGDKNNKRKASSPRAPTRQSKRIAEASTKPSYNDDQDDKSTPRKSAHRKNTKRGPLADPNPGSNDVTSKDVKSITDGWTSWESEADEPVRDATGVFNFESHPDFRPNKSPEEIIREGSFGGSYWRPLFSKRLGISVKDDWRELPTSWTDGLNVDQYLTSNTYDPEINKYGVACGQSIEEWEAAGWIAHEYDVRGWFQWYCRFWMGRRCPDDERQISRWKKCVGETGRWRRILLKKYVALGIRTVFADDGDDEDGVDVSPVVHQTCHHWAYEVRQDALERFWAEGK
ncbi:hypothetical protein F53441_2856 [Fusarium austroafricanum]|uniref:Vegetatible incompatibility protein HET-E-1 n=1 Tax=Fusarium austroafricanum TaxID=2364996 RepID=A0A8H4PBC9_9HYPO|nr:hypothetical protein F53441_2856 [Fusarium austroafricanum]